MPYAVGPYDSMHLYLQWAGALPGGERFSCGVRLGSTGAVTSLDPVSMIGAATTAVSAFHQRSTTAVSGRALLDSVKLNAIAPAGTYVEQDTVESILTPTPGGGNAAGSMPNQIALAISLTTGFSRGPAHRGRFFLPMPVVAVQANGTVAAVSLTEIGLSTDTLLADLNAINPSWKVCVFSRKSGAPGHRLVTGCEIGSVLDTQRRRRRSIPEVYA